MAETLQLGKLLPSFFLKPSSLLLGLTSPLSLFFCVVTLCPQSGPDHTERHLGVGLASAHVSSSDLR